MTIIIGGDRHEYFSAVVLYSKNMVRCVRRWGVADFRSTEMYVSTYSLQNVARTD